MTTTNNTNNNRHIANIVEKIMRDDDEEDITSIPGLNDMHTAGAGTTAAANLTKVDQGSKAPSSSVNTSSIWSRMKSSFYASGGKNKQDDQVVERSQSQSMVNESEANLAEVLRSVKEEEEKWQLTNRSISEKDDADTNDSLLGGTIIVPGGGELSLANNKDNGSPGLSFRASMAGVSMADISLLAGEEEQTNDKKAEAKEETSVLVPGDICLLGSTIETLARDDAAKAGGIDLKMPFEDNDASVADGKANDESTPITGLVDATATGGDDETFGQVFAGIGERMFLSDTVDSAPETAPDATNGAPKVADENAAPATPTASGTSKYRTFLVAFIGLCLLSPFAWLNFANVEDGSVPIQSTVDIVPPKAVDTVEPVDETTPTNDEPTKANTSCFVGGVEYAFGAPYPSSDGCSNCLCGFECTETVCPETNAVEDEIVPPPPADAKVNTSASPIIEKGSEYDDVKAASELLCSEAAVFVVALLCLVWSCLNCLPIKPFFKKTARKGTKGNATTPSRGSATTPSREAERGGARMNISNHRPTPRPGMTRTPVTATPRRSHARRKNHDERDMFASTVKVEVRTRKGRFVEVRRSARILKFGSPMKTVKREP